jgi:glutamate-1-semialdehyde 2,1-aminomutase
VAEPVETATAVIDRPRLMTLIERERQRFADEHPNSRAAFENARDHLLGGVPMSWMAKWPGGFPLSAAEAQGARITDVDGRTYVDFCLGDTGAMAGHSPAPTVRAVTDRLSARGGATMMLPTWDSAWAGDELTRRFGVPYWQFTLSATDANRFAIRMARQITGRPKILVFSYCYHGTVDETFITLAGGRPRSRAGNVGPPVDPTVTTRVAEFNDLAGIEEELAHGDVACVLTEPALTNIGIVLPDPGFHERLRELVTAAGALLIIDETHTFSAGAFGCTGAWGLRPDVVTIGKSIGGGVPVGAFGVAAEVAERLAEQADADYEDTGGVGGTLAGNALSMAAVRGTLGEVLTEEAFARMISLCERFEKDVREVLTSRRVPWTIVRLGARAEYRFCPQPPRSGGESAAAGDDDLDEYMHLYMLNRGILMTPFHNMALMCPATTEEDVALHKRVFAEAVDDLLGSGGQAGGAPAG